MADIRIKDLATTASTTASDDFMAVDGTTNGTRKLSAATPSFATSVTVPGVAGPTATDLTLTGGSTGASLVLSATTSGAGTLSVTGTSGAATGALALQTSFATTNSATRLSFANTTNANLGIVEGGTSDGGTSGYVSVRTRSGGSTNEVMRATALQNVLIGTTTDTNSRLKLVGADSSGPKTWTASSAALSGALFDSYQDSGGNGFQRYTDIVSLQDSDGVNGGGVIRFVTNSISSDSGTEAMRVTKLQNVLIGGTTDIPGSGGLKVFGTTAASSTTTGALQVAGGVGVAGNVVAGGFTFGTVPSASYPFYAASSTAGIPVSMRISHSDGTNVTSNARIILDTASGGGDPFVNFISGAVEWSLGIDNSASDVFKLSRSGAIGTTDALTIDGSNAATFAGAVTIAGGSNTASAGAVNLTSSSYGGGYTLKDGTKYLGIFSKSSGTQLCFYTNQSAGTDFGSLTPDLIINTGTSTFAGAVTVSSTTAGSAGAGALVVSGGLATGAASYFGGNVSLVNTADANMSLTRTGGVALALSSRASSAVVGSAGALVLESSNTTALTLAATTGAATFAGSVITPAATTAISSVRLPHGTAPTSPVNGDMWTTTAGLYVRINGVTVGPLS